MTSSVAEHEDIWLDLGGANLKQLIETAVNLKVES